MKSKQVWAHNEWSPLKTAIVGRAENSLFPAEPRRMIEMAMPARFVSEFYPHHPFPADHVAKAKEELEGFAKALEREGVEVLRPDIVDWNKVGGYSAAMPRDGLMVVEDHIIEAPFSWRTREHEIELAYSTILDELARRGAKVVRAPPRPVPDTIYGPDPPIAPFAINNSRPAFDTADFMRFGKTIVGQYSHVTNEKGVEYLRSVLPPGYTVEMIESKDPQVMHIDTTLVPLREGLLVYYEPSVSEEQLRKLKCFDGWDLVPLPFTPEASQNPPRYMVHASIMINVLVLDGEKIFVEQEDTRMQEFLVSLGMKPIPLPFRHLWGMGGSFHCTTSDLLRVERGNDAEVGEVEKEKGTCIGSKRARTCLGGLWSLLGVKGRHIGLEGEDEWTEKI